MSPESGTTPTVSVIIPCYKQAHYLPQAVRSVAEQTFENWECIIVDDGSPDETREVALSLVAGDSRVKYVQQPNDGVSRARNHGLDEARGKYIQFLDSDDTIDSDKLEKQIDALCSISEPALAYCDYRRIDDQAGPVAGWYVSPQLDHERPLQDLALRWETELSIPLHCFLFDSRLFNERHIRFDETLRNNEDWDCWMRIFALQPHVVYVDQKLASYRRHADSSCCNRVALRRGFLQAIRKQRRLLRHDPNMRSVLAKKMKLTAYQYRDYGPWPVAWNRTVSVLRRISRLIPHSAREKLKAWLGRGGGG